MFCGVDNTVGHGFISCPPYLDFDTTQPQCTPFDFASQGELGLMGNCWWWIDTDQMLVESGISCCPHWAMNHSVGALD